MNAHVAGFEHVEHPVHVPSLDGDRDPVRRPVLIAGGGPVGLATALALAAHGVPSLVVEADTTVCVGSRAICLSRRTFEILDRLGALAAIRDKGLAWTGGRSFRGTREVLHFTMPHDDDQRLAPMTNIQQYYIEQYLLDAIDARTDGLIEIRWGTRVASVSQDAGGVAVGLEADGAPYTVEAEYLVACDGARSQVRQELGLRMAGTAYEGRYVIVDIELDVDLPTERLAWFDPPSNPGRTMLMHRQPDRVWRLDYQLAPHEDSEEMLREERITPVIEAHLAMMGIDAPWRLVWKSMYRAAAVSLDRYRHGRVVFAGDAAHLVPIFGVRGLNSGFDDAFNLGWKLAWVVRGLAGDSLLDSYGDERRAAWAFNVANAMKSTEFMAPPSRGFELMRDAVLSLAERHPPLSSLVNPRQSSTVVYAHSPLSTPTPDETLFSGGPLPGAPLPECPLRDPAGATVHLTQCLSDGFTLVLFAPDGDVPAELGRELDALARRAPVAACVIVPTGVRAGPGMLIDERGRARTLLDAEPGTAILVRPDGHVAARWRRLPPGALTDAVERALGLSARLQ